MTKYNNTLKAKALRLNPNQREMVLELANRTREVGLNWMKGGYHDSQCGMTIIMLADWLRFAVGKKMYWEMNEAERTANKEETQRQLYGPQERLCCEVCGTTASSVETLMGNLVCVDSIACQKRCLEYVKGVRDSL